MSRSKEGAGGEDAAIQLMPEADLSLHQGPQRWGRIQRSSKQDGRFLKEGTLLLCHRWLQEEQERKEGLEEKVIGQN